MNDYFSLNNLFYNKQYLFRKYHLIEYIKVALNVVDAIIIHMDDGNTLFTAYLDLSKF